MKKIIIMMAMLFTIVPLTACNESIDAFELLEHSHVAQAELGSIIMEMDAQINMSMIGMPVSIPLTMRMEMENEERMRMDMNISVMGMDMSMIMFLRDGYMYSEMNMFGMIERERSAVGIGVNEAMEMAEMISLFDASFIADSMIEYSAAQRTDGGYRLELALNIDGVISFFENMELVNDFLDFGETVDEWDIVMIMYINDDYLPISSELVVEFEDMSMNMTLTTVQLGNVTINFPYWLDEISAIDSFDDSALLGFWRNGSGRYFLWVFGEANTVEFLVDGTLIISEDEQREVVDWKSTEPGTFTADGDLFTYSIMSNILTITDRSNDSWSFYR